MPEAVQTEADMVANIGELVSRAGVYVRARAECQNKFTGLLLSMKGSMNRNEIVERAKITRSGSSTPTPSTGGRDNGGDNGGGDGIE